MTMNNLIGLSGMCSLLVLMEESAKLTFIFVLLRYGDTLLMSKGENSKCILFQQGFT